MNTQQIKETLLIRVVEESFLKLFSEGKLNGTVHTCVGQELSAIAFAGQLKKSDFVFSNHRCHGHYISFTKDYRGLIAELLGKKSGVCGGVGSSQHLQNGNFYSNGIQGGIMPLAAGMALVNKLENNNNIGIVFIGDGTLGEGVVYETLNIISLWKLPLLVVCENNQYAQSTSIHDNLAGSITERAKAFGIKTFESDTYNADVLLKQANESINYVRGNITPAFHLVNTYRLNAHSKGDDNRDQGEIEKNKKKDFVFLFSQNNPDLYNEYLNETVKQVEGAINELLEEEEELNICEYYKKEDYHTSEKWDEAPEINERQVVLLNHFFDKYLQKNKKALFLGEDVLSPYGGAFKVANGLSDKYPKQVFTTPLSEAAITGIANGLAIGGCRPFVEIMFGDFITLSFDQIVNHAAKFYHMYNHKVNCPVVIRTPMGGRRGYGPTHSQTLDRFLIGVDNVKTVALNTIVNPAIIYEQVAKEDHPVIVIENKLDYGKFINKKKPVNFNVLISNDIYPVVKVTPINTTPNLSIVTYGGMVNEVLECLVPLFVDYELISEVIVLTKINPMDYEYEIIYNSISTTRQLVVVEEGNTTGGVGSEIIAEMTGRSFFNFKSLKIGSFPVPIPSVKSLENEVLPSRDNIIQKIIKEFC